MKKNSQVRQASPSKGEFDRRAFLKSLGGLGMAPSLGGGFFGALSSLGSAANDPDPDGPILVLIHQAGGNDALNTVVPIDTVDSEYYYQGRPSLALNENEALPLQDGYGLHPRLVQLKQLWDEGTLSVINGVGNPSPNLSHFRSRDIWEAANFSSAPKSGWLGRYFDHRCEQAVNFESTIGIELNSSTSLAFLTKSKESALTVQSPLFFDYLSAKGDLPTARDFDGAFRKEFLAGLIDRGEIKSGTQAYATSALKAALSGSDSLQDALENSSQDKDEVAFPATTFAKSLRNVARYIGGGMNTSTYFLTQGGYDTHASQYILDGDGRPLLGRHANLLGDLDSALGAFSAEMKRQGAWDRVTVMVYSEFSRKIIENGNQGSDHGAAGSVFIAGGQVQPGFYGDYPSLAPESRILNESMPMTTDFRRVYRTILERWYGLDPVEAAELLDIPTSEHPPLDFLIS